MSNHLQVLVDNKVDEDVLLLAPDFIRNRQQDLFTLKAAYAMKDFEAIGKICQKLKGFSTPFGFTKLEFLAHQLEIATIAKNPKLMDSTFSDIQSYISDKSQKLEELIG
jgi:HPt (histidine-containing phosphotransfer) domain-containing protein